MSLQTIALRPEVSLIEVMRRFRAQPDARIFRARHTRAAVSTDDHWRIQFTGPTPELSDLARPGAI